MITVITVTIDSVWGLAKIINRVMCCNEVSPVIQLSPATEAQTVNLKVSRHRSFIHITMFVYNLQEFITINTGFLTYAMWVITGLCFAIVNSAVNGAFSVDLFVLIVMACTPGENTGLWLVHSSRVTWIPTSDWLKFQQYGLEEIRWSSKISRAASVTRTLRSQRSSVMWRMIGEGSGWDTKKLFIINQCLKVCKRYVWLMEILQRYLHSVFLALSVRWSIGLTWETWENSLKMWARKMKIEISRQLIRRTDTDRDCNSLSSCRSQKQAVISLILLKGQWWMIMKRERWNEHVGHTLRHSK